MFGSSFCHHVYTPILKPDPEKKISWLLNDQITEIICTYFVHCIKIFRPGAVARSVECPIRLQAVRSRSSRLAHSFIIMYIFPSSTDSRRANCQLPKKEWTLYTGKFPSGGMPRKNVVKFRYDLG